MPFVLLGSLSFFIMQVRGTPLIWSDIYMIKEAVSLIPIYIKIEHILAIMSAVTIVIVCLSLGKKYDKKYYTDKIFNLRTYLILNVIALSVLIYGINSNTMEIILWDNQMAYESNGFIYSFLESCKVMSRKIPKDYNQKVIEELMHEIKNNQVQDTKEDYNLIILQLEGVMDPKIFENLEFSSDPIVNMRRLYKEGIGGNLFLPTFGGGTVRSELEVLTGINLDYLAPGEIPHNTGILRKRPIESIAHILKREGYATTVLHNFEGNFYNRHAIFPMLGFERYVPMEYMIGVDWSEGWPKDKVILDYIKRQIEESEGRDFIYAIGVQTHGAFDSNYSNPNSEVIVKSNESLDSRYINQMQDYIDSLIQVDKFVNEVNEYIQQLDEPTILTVFSDHYPSLDITNEMDNSMKYTIPYFILSNRELKQERQDVEAYQLSGEILRLMNIKTGVLPQFHNSYKLQADYQNKLEVLQYDILFGNQYALDGMNYNKTDMKLGMDEIKIHDVVMQEDKINIIGEGFTVSSKVFIDDKYYETQYIDTNTLVVSKFPKKLKYVQVKQIGKYNVAITQTDKFIYR